MPAPRGIFAALFSLLVLVAAAASPASVAWPASTGLVVAEVVTGGASASDEFVEIANAGAVTLDLGGLEIVYASASGATVTRKAVFASPLLLEPNRHFLLANSAGIYADEADATYSGGLAAEGGAVALRQVGGAVVDSVGWGSAVGSFVETRPAPAPPAKSSVERLPGGASGNVRDTNDNLADFVVLANPVAQYRACDPVPAPTREPSSTPGGTPEPSSSPSSGSTPTESSTPAPDPSTPVATESAGATDDSSARPSVEPSPTPAATETPTPEDTPEPTGEPTAVPTPPATPPTPRPTCTITPGSSPTASPSRAPSAAPSQTARPSATIGPSLSVPTPTPAPTVAEPDRVSLGTARSMPAGAKVHVSGAVTAGPGLVGDDAVFVMADETAGVFVRVAVPPEWARPGREVEVVGTLAAPYGQLEIRNVSRITPDVLVDEPQPTRVELAAVGESTEGSLVSVRGTVESVATDGGHLSLTVGDDETSVRVFADPLSGVTRADVAVGDVVAVAGIVGQRATATGRLDGYRVWLRGRADLAVRAPIEPDPSPVGTAPPPTASPSSSAGPARDLAAALGTRGRAVDVEAVVTATAGLFEIDGPTIVVDDGTASVAVVLPSGLAAPAAGAEVHLLGKVGRWEGGPTVRATSVQTIGQAQQPAPTQISVAPSADLEWRLVRVYGRIDHVTRAGARWRADMLVNGHPVAVIGEPIVGSLTSDAEGRMATVTGIVRRSTSDSSSFQLLPRSSADIRLGPALAVKGAGAASGSGGTPTAVSTVIDTVDSIPLSELGAHVGARATIAGLVTGVESGVATVEDGTGSARVGGSAAAAQIDMLEPGDAIEVTGMISVDELGPLLLADAESVVVLPGQLAGETATASSTLAWNPAAAGSTASAGVLGDSSMRATSTDHPTDLPTFAAVIVLATLLIAAGVVATRPLWRRAATPAVSEGGASDAD